MDTALRIADSLQVSLAASYLGTAEYRDDLAGLKGQRLPFAPKYNGSLGIQYDYALDGNDGYVRADISYIGKSGTSLAAPDIARTDAYARLDMRAGLTFGKVKVEIYGTNLTNEKALAGVFNFDRGWRITPRTIGIDVTYRY